MDRRFTQMDRRFTEMDHEMDGRFTGMAREMDRQFGAMSVHISTLEDRIVELRHDMLGRFDRVYRRLDRLEREYQAITQALRRIEAGLADERGRREILERDLAEVKRQLTALHSRIEEIEQRLGR